MSHERRLDRLESWLLNMPRTSYVEYQGTLDKDAIRRAINLTSLNCPMLRAHIERRDDSYYFSVPDEAELAILEVAADSNIFRKVASEWDPTRAVAKVTLATNTSGGYLGLTTDHSVADGRATHALLEQVWRNYRQIKNGGGRSLVKSLGLTPSPTQIMRQRGLMDDPGSGEKTDSDSPTIDKVVLRQRFHGLSLFETKTLKRVATQRGSTVHALICGAVLSAQRAHAATSDLPTEMSCISTVDLRRQVAPALGPNEVTNLSGVQRATVEIPTDADPIDIGVEFKRKLTDGISSREPLVDFLRYLHPHADYLRDPTTEFTTATEGRINEATISNLGALPEISCPGDVEIVDYQFLTYAGLYLHPAYMFFSHNGRMGLQFVYRPDLFLQEQMDQLWVSVREGIDRLVS